MFGTLNARKHSYFPTLHSSYWTSFNIVLEGGEYLCTMRSHFWREGPCMVRFNALWLIVTWDPFCGRITNWLTDRHNWKHYLSTTSLANGNHYLQPDRTKESATAMEAKYHDMALILLCGWTMTWGKILHSLSKWKKSVKDLEVVEGFSTIVRKSLVFTVLYGFNIYPISPMCCWFRNVFSIKLDLPGMKECFLRLQTVQIFESNTWQ